MEPETRRAARTSEFVAQTRFSGCIVASRWSRAAVERILPAGIRLATEPGRTGKRHPVLFLFGEHDRSAVVFALLELGTGGTFREFLIAVPFVSWDDAVPRMFVCRVFSGERIVTWSGNIHYGFPKSMVPMERLGNSFVVSDDRGALLVHASAEPAGPWEPAGSSRLPGLLMTLAVARLPVVGCRPDGTSVASRFEWALGDAEIRPVRAVVSIDAPLGPGLEPRVCHASARDALEVRAMRWRLSWPEARGAPVRCEPRHTPPPGRPLPKR